MSIGGGKAPLGVGPAPKRVTSGGDHLRGQAPE